jgi:transcriptional regulator with XRE-family HTH domain
MKASKQFRKIEGIAATRQRLGITQEDLAQHLGISPRMVGMVENRQRTLPSFALVKLASLEILLAGQASIKATQQPLPIETAENGLNDHCSSVLYYKEMKARAEASALQYKLQAMETNYQQLRVSLDHTEKMISSGSDFDMAYLHMHRYTLTRKVTKCSLAAQASLRHKIALLHAAAELHKSVQREFCGGGEELMSQ